MKQLQDDANLAYKDELRRIGINIIKKEKEKNDNNQNRYNSLSESYKSRQSKYNERRKKNNDDIDQYNINNKLYKK